MPTTVAQAANIDQILDRAMAQNLIAGGVVVVGNHEGILATAARGHLGGSSSPLINERTIFDLASLTKVIATTPAVVKLLDEGKISVDDPVSRYIPEFANYAAGQLTIKHLMTHTSGLDDMTVSPSIETTIRRAAAERNRPHPGAHFHYADINFIVLAELVHRVSGQTLDAFCQQEIYAPLGADETMFLPPRSLAYNIAPTTGFTPGVVQDPNARRLGGVAGHAGLFSSAYDLSRYARLLLGGGMIDNKRIFSEQAVAEMTTPYAYGSVRRGLGWDISSPYSAPRGTYFSEASFGHTGYSGSSIWIDPQQDLFVVLLTRRTNYRQPSRFNQLRRDVSTLASADFRFAGQGGTPAPQIQLVSATTTDAQVLEAAAPAIAAAPQAIEVYEKDGVVVATNMPQHKRHVQRHIARVSTRAGVHHASRHVRVARAETKWVHKKRRTLAKS
jgi:CubicO group peptidase (beta-lactamase class C family)